mgnify:CR=1 FL=1
MKLITKKLNEKVFDNYYFIAVGESDDANKWLSRVCSGYQPNLDNDYACAIHNTVGNRATIIYFSTEAWKSKEYKQDTIAHEALHATIRSLMAHGVKFEEDNHEVFCYTLGWLVREINKLPK